MAKAERAFDERDIATEGYLRVVKKCIYNPQLCVSLWTNFFRLCLRNGLPRTFIRDGQLELERSGYYWTGD
jgi:hypothetical protein